VVIDWNAFQPVAPGFTGTKVFDGYDLADIVPFIDWGPFFIAWELHGKFPQILKDEVVGVEATRLYNDARELLDRIVAEKWFEAKGCDRLLACAVGWERYGDRTNGWRGG